MINLFLMENFAVGLAWWSWRIEIWSTVDIYTRLYTVRVLLFNLTYTSFWCLWEIYTFERVNSCLTTLIFCLGFQRSYYRYCCGLNHFKTIIFILLMFFLYDFFHFLAHIISFLKDSNHFYINERPDFSFKYFGL